MENSYKYIKAVGGVGGGGVVTKCASDRKTLLTIYNAYILSRVQYGAQAFSSAPEHIHNKLDVTEIRALRIISRASIGTSVSSIQAELDIMPLKHKRQMLLPGQFKTKGLSLNNPVLNLVPNIKKQIGIPFKNTIKAGDSFVAYIYNGSLEFNMLEVPLVIVQTKDHNPWLQTPANIPLIIRNELKYIEFPPFNFFFKLHLNESIHIYVTVNLYNQVMCILPHFFS